MSDLGLNNPGFNTRFGRSRGRIQNGGFGLAYPSPFFDIATTYIPQSMQSLFRHLREYFLLNGALNVVVQKLAEYPITEIIFSDGNDQVARRYQTFFEDHLMIRRFQVECGLDYYCYGNCLVSVRYPIIKWLSCKACGHKIMARNHRDKWKFRGYKFYLNCQKCGTHEQECTVVDQPEKVAESVRLIRWDPESVQIRFNPLTRTRTYYFNIPGQLKADIMMGRKDVVEELPQVYIQALSKNEMVVIPESEIFHMARPSISGFDPGWGTPLLLPVLKEAFQLQVMRKAQETVLLEHLVPLRIIFPQPAAGTADPFSAVPLPMWKEAVNREIMRWRWDPAYVPVMPLPIGHQSVGGDGKSLLIQPEMTALIDYIITSLGVPREFIQGGASWSGSNVSLRTVENMFMGYIQLQLQLVRFIQSKIATVCNWPLCDVRFKPFRMADDIQRKQWLSGLVQGDLLSQTTFLREADFDAIRENELKEKEVASQIAALKAKQLAMAHMQGEVNAVNLKYQMEQQQQQMAMQNQMNMEQQQQQMAMQQGQMGEQQAPPPGAMGMGAGPTLDQMLSSRMNMGGVTGGIDIESLATTLAQQVAAVPAKDQQLILQNLQASLPAEVYSLVIQKIGPSIEDGPKNLGAVSAPPPEQRPPRRPQS